MSFLDTFCEMLVILVAIALGYLAHRKGFLGDGVDQKLCKLILNITMPAMIVGSVASGSTLPEMREVLSILRVAVIFYGLELLFALVVPHFLGGRPEQKGVWRFGLVFSNVGFIGYPVAVALFGQDALFYAVVLALPFNMLSFTLGPLMLVGAKRFQWKQMLSPCVVASLTALVLALGRIPLPALVGETLNFVGDITVPLSLLVVGSLLAGLPVKRVFSSPRLWVLTVLRLLVLPTLLWLLLRGMEITPMVLGIAIVQMAMPVAVNGSMLCIEYGGDKESMAQATFLSTLTSIFTIPLIAALFL